MSNSVKLYGLVLSFVTDRLVRGGGVEVGQRVRMRSILVSGKVFFSMGYLVDICEMSKLLFGQFSVLFLDFMVGFVYVLR